MGRAASWAAAWLRSGQEGQDRDLQSAGSLDELVAEVLASAAVGPLGRRVPYRRDDLHTRPRRRHPSGWSHSPRSSSTPWRSTSPPGPAAEFLFTTEHGDPIRRTAFSTAVWRPAVRRAGLSGVTMHSLATSTRACSSGTGSR